MMGSGVRLGSWRSEVRGQRSLTAPRPRCDPPAGGAAALPAAEAKWAELRGWPRPQLHPGRGHRAQAPPTPRPHTGFVQSRPPAALGEGPGVGGAKKGAWSLGCSGRGRGRGRGYHAVGAWSILWAWPLCGCGRSHKWAPSLNGCGAVHGGGVANVQVWAWPHGGGRGLSLPSRKAEAEPRANVTSGWSQGRGWGRGLRRGRGLEGGGGSRTRGLPLPSPPSPSSSSSSSSSGSRWRL